MTELGVVTVGVEQRVRQVRLGGHAVGHRTGEPALVGLSGEPHDPEEQLGPGQGAAVLGR